MPKGSQTFECYQSIAIRANFILINNINFKLIENQLATSINHLSNKVLIEPVISSMEDREKCVL